MTIETVTFPADGPPATWGQLLNPIWWLMNGNSWTAPLFNNGQPYLPSINNWFLRNLLWFFRNPCANFVGYVIGFNGRTYSVTGPAPVLLTTWADATPPQAGWKWSVINGAFPFISYSGRVVFYLGWRPAGGGFGLKIVAGHVAG